MNKYFRKFSQFFATVLPVAIQPLDLVVTKSAVAALSLSAAFNVALPSAGSTSAETDSQLLRVLTSPVLFRGDAQTAYRDPLILRADGTFWMFFTLITHDAGGRPYWQTAYSRSSDLAHWSAPVSVTPRDRKLNYRLIRLRARASTATIVAGFG